MKNKLSFLKPWVPILTLVCGLMNASPIWAGVPDRAVRIEAGCSRLDIQDAPLPMVTQALSQESDIQIRLLSSLTGEFISAQIYAKDCSDAVLMLLQEFSMIKFWGDDGHLVAVQLLSRRKAWVPEAKPQEASVSLVSTQPVLEQPPLHMTEALNKYQVQALIDVAQGKLSPMEVMYNPLYEPYLKKVGLIELEDWKDKKKVKILRRHALQAWMQLRKASSSR